MSGTQQSAPTRQPGPGRAWDVVEGASRPPSVVDPTPPLVSVAIAPLNAETTLPAALDAVLGQDLQRIEVLIADRGSTDGTRGVASDYAAADPRVRLVMTRTGTLGGALDAAAGAARAEHLLFVRDTDEVRPQALRRMIRTLRASGSDFVVGALDQMVAGRPRRSAITRPLHLADRNRVALVDRPEVLVDTDLTNTLFRTRFWRDHVGGFRHDVERVESTAMVTAFLAAASFDLLAATTCRSRPQADTSSLIQGRVTTPVLRQAGDTADAIWALLTAQRDQTYAEHWLAGFLDRELGVYVDHSVHVDAVDEVAYRSLLGEIAERFVGRALAGTGTAWTQVRHHRRLLAWLAAERRWDDIDELVEWVRVEGELPPTTVTDGVLVAALPMATEWDCPPVVNGLAPYESGFAGCIEKAVWTARGRLAVQGWAFLRGLDLNEHEPEITAWFVGAGGTARVEVDVAVTELPQANRWSDLRFADVSPAGFRFLFDPATLPVTPADDSRTTNWQLVVQVAARGLTVSGTITTMVRTGVDQRVAPMDLEAPDAPVRLVPLVDGALGFCLQRRVIRAHATKLSVRDRTVRGELALRSANRTLRSVRLLLGDESIEAPVVAQSGDRVSFGIGVPERHDPGTDGVLASTWSLRAIDDRGDAYYVSWPPESSVGLEVTGPDGDQGKVSWRRSGRAFCSVNADRAELQVVEVTVGPGLLHDSDSQRVRVVVESHGIDRGEVVAALLRGPHSQVATTRFEVLPGSDASPYPRYVLDFPLHAATWGRRDRPLSAGSYQIFLPASGLAAVPSDPLLGRCPEEGSTEVHGWTVHRLPASGEFRLVLRAPLRDTERSAYDRYAVRRWYDTIAPEPRDAVLFQCFRGEFATDSQRAIHEELFRRETSLELLWAVSDYSVELPEGAVPVLINSHEWYEATAAARYLCQNIDYDRWFRRRPHQHYLQTFHGYPFKSMGIALWKAQGRSDRVVDGEVERRTQAWTSILLPDESTVEMYRQAYRYDGDVLVAGYPRDDSILGPERDEIRERTRAKLGLADGQKAVLYAPTWRDTAATGAWTAEMFDELDLDRIISELGSDFTVLLRGHNYVFRARQSPSVADVVDVTSYPEINDLILAADVAVLDYSSLRFDWMLSGKPAVFFVPDLDDYLSARTALFDYRPTAPGPLLRTTDEVIDALRDLDGITETYAADRATFNATFQPLNDGHAAARVVDTFFTDDAARRSEPAAGQTA